MLLLISYQFLPLVQASPETTAATGKLQAEITAHAIDQRQPISGTWLIDTSEDVDVWAHRLRPLIADTDRLLVTRVQGRTNGLLPPEFWGWINPRAV